MGVREGAYGERGSAIKPITGSGAETPAGSRGRVPGQGVREAWGKAPLKLKNVLLLDVHWKPQSWIGFTRVGTTHEEYLVVFVTVQNLVVIGAVISIVCKF